MSPHQLLWSPWPFIVFLFGLADHPVIISGQTLLFMDPFREEHEAIYMTSLDDLDTEERQALRHALSPLLHVLSKKSLTGWCKNYVCVGGGGGGGGRLRACAYNVHDP